MFSISLSTRPCSILALTAAALLFVSGPAAEALAQAGQPPEQPPHEGAPVRILSHEEALLQDARSYASDYNVSLEEAQRRLDAQDHQGDVIERLRNTTRGRLAGLWIEHKPEFRLVVRLKGDAPAPPEFQNAAAGSRIPVAFATGAAATQEEVLAKIPPALGPIKAALPGLQASDVDVKTGEVVLIVHAAGAAGEAAKAKGPELGKLLGHPVRIDLIDAPEQNAHTRGGANQSTCTSGFVVANSAGTRGVLTAGHCPNALTYYEFGGTSYAMTFVAEAFDADQDVQWHTTTHDEYPEFYADSTTTARVLTGRRLRTSTAPGNYACHRGKASGYSCGTVESITHQPSSASLCNGYTCTATYIRVSGTDLRCYEGDSGGPWFNCQTAFGIMKSNVSTGPGTGQCTYAVYMSTDYISGMGLSLVYGP